MWREENRLIRMGTVGTIANRVANRPGKSIDHWLAIDALMSELNKHVRR